MDRHLEPSATDPSGWVELNVSALEPDDGTSIPFTLMAHRFKSSTPECEAFIHSPLGVLLEAARTNATLRSLELTPDWHVTTFVVNHHRTLSATHLYAMAAVDPDEKTVGITLVKRGT